MKLSTLKKIQHMILRTIAALWVGLSLYSCNNVQNETEEAFAWYFNPASDTAFLAANTKYVAKSIRKDGTQESNIVEANITNELLPIIELNINKASSKAYYSTKDSTISPNEHWVEYATNQENQKVKKVIFHFLDSTCTYAEWHTSTKSAAFETKGIFKYWPRKKYEYALMQNVSNSFETVVEVQTIFGVNASVWQAQLNLGKAVLNSNFFFRVDPKPALYFFNAEEVIEVTDIQLKGDSLIAEMPVFDTYLKLKFYNDSTLSGHWIDSTLQPIKVVPFEANKNTTYRYASQKALKQNWIDGKWKLAFDTDEHNILGVFTTSGNYISGSLLTEAGDYRFLQGSLVGDTAILSTFDGAHAYVIKAVLENDSLNGTFYYRGNGALSLHGIRDENFELTNPFHLTKVVDSTQKVHFTLANTTGDSLDFPNESYTNKVVLINLMGSWCPNCMDDSKLLTELYNNYNAQGLEVISLGFERQKDIPKALQALQKIKTHFNADYPFLYAGNSNKNAALELFPMLNQISSFPTTIYLNKKGDIAKIFTGFYGPGTGEYYTRYKKETVETIEYLLNQ